MKKRIIIIPIAIMSLLLGACGKKDVAPVYAESWLTNVKDNDEDPNSPSFYLVNEEGEIDCRRTDASCCRSLRRHPPAHPCRQSQSAYS